MEKEASLPFLYGATPRELDGIAALLGLPRHAAGQLAGWLYGKHAADFQVMSDLSLALRGRLAASYSLGYRAPLAMHLSADGTRKYLFLVRGERAVETALIPDRGRVTLCLSTQVGCRMGCRFCMTARQGFQGNLAAAEILNQYRALPERDTVTNIVYMGMGEPLDNLEAVLASLEVFTAARGFGMSPTRITVSTIGVLPALETLVGQTRVHLALSLHSPFDDERAALIPAARAWPLAGILDALASRYFRGQRRLTLEYLLFAGVNDSRRHAAALAALARRLACRVNLLAWHALPDDDSRFPLRGAGREDLEAFQALLSASGVQANIRRSRGEDIGAACGLLSTKAGLPADGLAPAVVPAVDSGKGAAG